MSKSCSRCDKAVYPTEELKCLDKVIIVLKFYEKRCKRKVDSYMFCGVRMGLMQNAAGLPVMIFKRESRTSTAFLTCRGATTSGVKHFFPNWVFSFFFFALALAKQGFHWLFWLLLLMTHKRVNLHDLISITKNIVFRQNE